MQQFQTLNAQQQPFIQSGYGAMSKLNTLMGIGNPNPAARAAMPSSGPKMAPAYMPTPNGGINMRIPSPVGGAPGQAGSMGMRLRQILAMRAANGDTEAARMMETV